MTHRVRGADNRRQLEQATAAYYDALPPDAQVEEQQWAELASRVGAEVDFDWE